MDSEQRSGAAIMILGAGVLAMTSISSPPGTAYAEPFSFLLPAVTIVPGLCLIGLGFGKYTGKLNTATGTGSKRGTALLGVIAIGLFAMGFLLTVK